MAVKIRFDTTHNAEQPTFVLATRNGNLLGKLPVNNVQFKDCLNSYADLSFEVNKADCINEKDKNEFIKITPISVYGLVGDANYKTRIGQITSNQLSELNQYMQMTEKLINSKLRIITTKETFEFTDIIYSGMLNIYSAGDERLNVEVDREGYVYLYSAQGNWNLNSEESCRIELSFEISSGEIRNVFWEQIKDFKLVWAREWNKLFEIQVGLNEEKSIRKTVSAKSLGETELSQINLYNIEINTETDIERKDYKPTILFNETDPSASLLSRIMEKAPHYHFKHIDSSIANIQRTFTFDNKSIYDAFQEIAEEINCLFQIECYLDENGNIVREINVYDLETYCYDCGHRGEFIDSCDECGSENVKMGYGDDTTIFITTENLANNISYTTDVDSVKNCFKLEAGDELMTATVANCNPNGSPYIWYISNELKEDMSVELVNKLAQYDESYNYYQNEYILDFSKYSEINNNTNIFSIVENYNLLVDKYSVFTNAYHTIDKPIVGYADIMQKYYDTIDFYLYLYHSLMPSVEISRTTAALEGAKINTLNLSPVAVQNLKSCSLATANSAVLAMAKTVVDSTRYQVKIKESTYADGEWRGIFTLTNYSDEEDTAETISVFVNINDDYEKFVKQRIDKILNKQSDEVTDIIGLFKLDENRFKTELKRYCLVRLNNFYDCCQSCLDILIEQGIADKETWANKNPDLYRDLYVPYYNKLSFIQSEINVREQEIKVIEGIYDKDGDLVTHGLKTALEAERDFIQDELNFEKYLGTNLWLEFVSYRREDTYENSNYISDGLDNAALFENALAFVEVAKKDIYKSATLQHSISSELKNLLVIPDFEPLLDFFEVGNWLKIKIDDKIYQLRLVDYQIDFNSLDKLSVRFSDVRKFGFGKSMTAKEKLDKAASMATSYDSVSRQAEKGKKSNDKLNDWVTKGLALTKMKIIDSADNQNITWDSHGLLCKEYLPITDTYDDKQLKIINKGLFLTDDNWLTSKAGIGNFNFYNPETGEMEESYGVIADTLVGNLILSEKVGIYNTKNSITLDENGVVITANNTIVGENQMVFTIRRKELDSDENEIIRELMYIDDDGNLVLNGSIRINAASDDSISSLDELTDVSRFTEEIQTNIHDEIHGEGGVYSTIDQAKADQKKYTNDMLNNYKAEVGQYMAYDENGLTLGASTSTFKTVIDNQRLAFYEGTNVAAYISNNQLYIPNAVVEKTLSLGKFFFSPRTDGGVSLSWQSD